MDDGDVSGAVAAAVAVPGSRAAETGGGGGGQPHSVVLHNLFAPASVAADSSDAADIAADVAEEARRCGAVVAVDVDAASGSATVHFVDASGAGAAIALFHGRAFDGRVVRAERAAPPPAPPPAEAPDEAQRIDAFGAWLEESEG